MRKAIIILFVLLIITSSSMLFAGTTGKIVGKIKAADGKKPIHRAAVQVLETKQGAFSDEKGQYFIINVSPGTYTIRCQIMGYHVQSVTEVVVNTDETTTINFSLVRDAVKMKGFSVRAQKKDMIDKGKGGSGVRMTTDDIDKIDADNIQDILATKPGFVKTEDGLHVRGSRPNEIQYTIDGMSVSDPVDGGVSMQVDNDAIVTFDAMSGGFPAEYGNAQSGVINITTKSGQKFFSGKLEYSTDHLDRKGGWNRDEIKFNLGGPVLPWASEEMREKFTFFTNCGLLRSDGRYGYLYKSDPNKELIYLTAQYPTYIPEEDPYRVSSTFGNYDNIFGKSNGFELDPRNNNISNANIKLHYQFTPLSSVEVRATSNKNTTYHFKNAWRYALQHYRFSKDDMRQIMGTYDQTINESSNLKIKASWYQKKIKNAPKGIELDDYYYKGEGFHGIQQWELIDPSDMTAPTTTYITYDVVALDGGVIEYGRPVGTVDGIPDYYDNQADDWRYQVPILPGEPQVVRGFIAPYTMYTQFIDDETTTASFRADLDYQHSVIHELKTGVELINYHIIKDRLNNPNLFDEGRSVRWLEIYGNPVGYRVNPTNPADSTIVIPVYSGADQLKAVRAAMGTADGYDANLWQGAYYLQDKMQWEGMLVNAGLRLDMWHLGKDFDIITSEYRGSYLETQKPDTAPGQGAYPYLPGILDDEGNLDTTHPIWLKARRDYDSLKKKFNRLNFILSPRLSVSHPISDRDVIHFAYNYQNQLPQMRFIYTTGNKNDGSAEVGNPDLEPQVTVTYEVGLQHQMSDYHVLDISAYFKNIYNYVSRRMMYDENDSAVAWLQYVSEDYGSARGIDIELERNNFNFISGNLAYTLAWAAGNSQGEGSFASEDNLREFPLEWDMRHSFSINQYFTIGKGEEAQIENLLDYVLLPSPILFFTELSFSDWLDTGVMIPFDDFSLSANYNYASGTPYSARSSQGDILEINGARKDYTHSFNMSISKGIQLPGKQKLRLKCSITNVFDTDNVNDVYGRTGSATDDGVEIDISNFVYEESEHIYGIYENDPSNFSAPRRITATVAYQW